MVHGMVYQMWLYQEATAALWPFAPGTWVLGIAIDQGLFCFPSESKITSKTNISSCHG